MSKPYYEHGGIAIYHGDCLDVLDSLDVSAQAIVMDPPYSSGTRQATNRSASNIPKRGEKWSRAGLVWDTSFSTFGLSVFANVLFRKIKAVLADGAHVYAFIDWRQYPLLSLSVESAGLFTNNLLVWDKGVYALGGNYRSQHELIVFASHGTATPLRRHDRGNVMSCKRVSGGEHPTEKPVDLIGQILDCAPLGIVIDPFMGGGSTLIAAARNGRSAVGIEIEERYCEIAAKRLAQETLPLEASA